MKRTSKAVWHGPGKEGGGHLSTPTQVFNKQPYNWHSRFSDGTHTNPEELIAAAHAGCYSMKLAFLLGEAGFTPEEVVTTSTVTIESGTITGSHLVLNAKVPGINLEKLKEVAEKAKTDCPVSKALAAIPITLEVTLVGETVA